MSAGVPTELDERALLERATRAAGARWPAAAISGLEPLQGGYSSLTFAARLSDPAAGDRLVVVKVAPPGLPPVRNRDVLRQARVLHALAGAPGVRVPEVLLEDAAAPPFFVMSFVEGESYEPKIDAAPAPPEPDVVAARARAAARMLASLQRVDHAAIGLGDEPALPLAGELERWARLFATTPEGLRVGAAELHRRLAASLPAAVAPTILHGDYRVGNMQFDGERLAAIIDWEIWSVGDPRTDLAWLLTFAEPVHRYREGRDDANLRAAEGMPSGDELLAEYLAVRPAEISDLGWFRAYCHYKIAATNAALIKRSRRSGRPDPGMEIAAATHGEVITRAHELLDAS